MNESIGQHFANKGINKFLRIVLAVCEVGWWFFSYLDISSWKDKKIK